MPYYRIYDSRGTQGEESAPSDFATNDGCDFFAERPSETGAEVSGAAFSNLVAQVYTPSESAGLDSAYLLVVAIAEGSDFF